MNDNIGKRPEQAARPLELAEYIADMLLELRSMARAAGLNTLSGLLEITFCEAYAIANKVEIPPGEVEKLKRLASAAHEG